MRPQSVSIPGTKKKQTVLVPDAITVKAYSEVIKGITNVVKYVRGAKNPLPETYTLNDLLSWADDDCIALNMNNQVQNLGVYFAEKGITEEEMPEAFKIALLGMGQYHANFSKSTAPADPNRTVKNRALSSFTVNELEAMKDIGAKVKEKILEEISALKEQMELAETLTNEEYLSYLAAKVASNGTDEEGYARIKGKSEKSETK
jgi:hypothetical protein